MIVVDPVTLGDTSLSGGGGSYYDKNGVLQTAAPGTPRLTYDPADLSKPPAVMLEPEATNYIRNNTMQGAVGGGVGSGGALPTNWSASLNNSGSSGMSCAVVGKGMDEGVDYVDIRFFGTPTLTSDVRLVFETVYAAPATAGETYSASLFAKLIAGNWSGVNHWSVVIDEYSSAGSYLVNSNTRHPFPTDAPLPLQRFTHTRTNTNSSTAYVRSYLGLNVTGGQPIDFTLRIGLPQLERDRVTSPIKASGTAVTRAAEVVGATAGLLYSNVPETEPLWVPGTYAKGAKVRDAAHVAYESLVDANAAPLTDKTKWLNLGATNRAAMFDDRNNTQTSNPEEIIVVLSPRAIAQGLLLGNLDATVIGVSATVPNYGVAYSETSSLIVSRSKSSFFRWGFNRLKRRSLFLTLKLPIFFNGVVTVTIRRPGGVAKCGMCMIGPTVDPGPTLMGLSSEIKDYSTTLFNTDGSSETIPRGYRKLMSMDVSIDTDRVVEAEEQMIAWRQKNVVWVGAPSRLDTIIVGRYSSFKKVIESFPRSKMALQIEGVLS